MWASYTTPNWGLYQLLHDPTPPPSLIHMCKDCMYLKMNYRYMSSNTEFSPSVMLTGPITELGRCGERATIVMV